MASKRARKLRSPLKLMGGKGHLRSKIVPYLPPHKTYVEPFGGGASVLLDKPKSDVEVYNDLDKCLVAVFTAIKDERLRNKLKELLWLTPYSREERKIDRVPDDEDTTLERARKFFVTSRQSFGGMIDRTSWGLVTNTSSRGMAQPVNSYIEAIRALDRVGDRIKDVLIKNVDWSELVDSYDTPHTLFYLDPPYTHGTRRDGWYTHEMDDDDHRKLVARLLEVEGMAVLSGYANQIYLRLEQEGWKKIDFSQVCYSVARTRYTNLQGDGNVKKKQKREDCIWMNPNASKFIDS